MARIVCVGAGIVGLGASMMLAADGHEVVVLERDSAHSPGAREAWDGWERKGVNQFRLPHGFMPRFRQILESELPQVASELVASGAYRMNPLKEMPDFMSGGWHEGDERFEVLTGRRPFMEAVLASVAGRTRGVEVQRGRAVANLITGAPAATGVPNVVGVQTEDGERIAADLVVDAGGRRSSLPALLTAIGARPPREELEDSGFMYFGRHFRSDGGAVPATFGPALIHWGTISSLSVICDNGTWCLGIITAARDRALLGLRQLDRWEAVVRSLPLVAHWLDGISLDEDVKVITKLEDRFRGFVVDGVPVATGVVAVGDSWAASNPSVGRGASIGMIHAQVLRDAVRCPGLDNPVAFADTFHQMTAERVEPWYRWTLAGDRHRLAEVEAGIERVPYSSGDADYDLEQTLDRVSMADPNCLRANLEMRFVITHPDEVMKRPGLAERIRDLAAEHPEAEQLGPDRSQLVALASG